MVQVDLISDLDALPNILSALYQRLYCPYLVTSTEATPTKPRKAKEWLGTLDRTGDMKWNDAAQVVPLDRLLAAAHRYPGHGISISSSRLLAPGWHPVILDVDVDADFIIDQLRLLLPDGIAAWAGRNAGTIMGRSPTPLSLKSILQEVNPSDRLLGGETNLYFGDELAKLQTAKGGEKPKIEIISRRELHCILPPTLHLEASDAEGREVRYRWIEGCARLDQTNALDLPIIEPWHLLAVYQYIKTQNSVFMESVREMAEGNWYTNMTGGTLYLAAEGWPADWIEAYYRFLMLKRGPQFSTPERRRELTTAVVGAIAKVRAENKKPSEPKGVARQSADAEMFDWLREAYPIENLANIAGNLCHWNGTSWDDLRGHHSEQGGIGYLFLKVVAEFPNYRHSYVRDAIKSFLLTAGTSLDRTQPPSVIAFADGIYDPAIDLFRPEERTDYVNGRLKQPWLPNVATPIYDSFIQNLLLPPSDIEGLTPECHEQAIHLINEWYGHALLPLPRAQLALFILGVAGVGKSVAARVGEGVFPRSWISGVQSDMLHDSNAIRDFAKIRLNVSSEMKGLQRKHVDNFKRITGGDPVDMKILYSDRAAQIASARLMFFGNEMGELDDVAGDIERRMMILRTTNIKPATVDRFEDVIIKADGEALPTKWAKACHDMIKRGHFAIPAYSQAEVRTAVSDGSVFNTWLEDVVEPLGPDEPNTQGVNLNTLYLTFQEYAEESGHKFVMTRTQFKARLVSKGHIQQPVTTFGGREFRRSIRPYRLRIVNDQALERAEFKQKQKEAF